MSKASLDIKDLAVDLCTSLRQVVLPHIGKAAARTHAGTAVGGDVTFGIDELAEDFLVKYLEDSGISIAVYSEDRGLLRFGDSEPAHVLIVDPVDGTRPAAAGLECAMVSVAVAELTEAPTMGDVVFGCLSEIKSGTTFTAARGEGVTITTIEGEAVPVILSGNTDLSKLFWTIGFRGRPARVLMEAMGDLVDISSVDGAVFDLGSATYSITRVLTGQLDAYIDIGPRMIEDVPEVKSIFEEVGKGAVLNNSPHDLAAAGIIAREAGAIFGDGWGKLLASRLLLGSDHSFQMSCVAAANQEMFDAIIEAMDEGVARLRSVYGKSA
ncbi:MAG: inositol monophosphatase family protein [Thermoleophilia bacterium]|nr:inositol monophosphatase family protein [Thermoleophilia bacterium]